MSSLTQVDHVPFLHATYAIPDESVRKAMLVFAPKDVRDIAEEIRRGHTKLNNSNKVYEFAKIGVKIPIEFQNKMQLDK